MVLLMLCVSGAVVATPSTNITISLTTTPQPPTDFDITQLDADSINITWTKGIGANITIVRGSTSGYPFSILDGDDIYSGNGTWIQVDSLDLTTYTYYYRAWSQNAYGTSIGYDEDSIGEAAGIDLSAIFAYFDDLMEGPMGVNSIIFIGVLLFIAVWKKGWIRIVMSLALIIWGAYSIPYDVKIAGPLLGVSIILFIEAIFRLYQQSRAEQQEV